VKVKTKIKLDYANAPDFGSPFPYIWRISVATPVYLSLKCTLTKYYFTYVAVPFLRKITKI
jgi:hypothetical protein